jgi:hypothetical protein
MKIDSSRRFSKITQESNLMKINPVGDELFHTDGRSDTTTVIVAFRNFAKASKMSKKNDRISLPTKMTETHICVAPNEALGIGSNVQ